MKKPIFKRYQKIFLSVTALSLFFLLCFALVISGTSTLGWGNEEPIIKLTVSVGETIVTITGTTTDASLNGQIVPLEIKGPNNNRIAVEQKTIQNGCFEWQIHRNTFTVAGKYTVNASVGASPVQAEAPFEIPSPAPSPKGGGGGGGGGPSCLDVEKLTPAKDASNVALDEGVSVTFKKEVEAVSDADLAKVTIKDAKSVAVGEVKATVKDKKLNIEHAKFAPKTKYTVTIPEKCVKGKTDSLYNCKIEWSFTTKEELTKEELIPGCEFKDLTKEHWAYECITKLCQQNIVNGYPDKTFRPGKNITRAEFAKLIGGALGLAKQTPGKATFKDVRPTDWHYGYVEAAVKAGLVKGYEGKFRPNDFITRQEITAIMIRAMGKESEALAKAQEKIDLADAAQISSWARGYVALAVKIGLLEGYPDNTFGPTKNATRAESSTMVCRYLEKSKK